MGRVHVAFWSLQAGYVSTVVAGKTSAHSAWPVVGVVLSHEVISYNLAVRGPWSSGRLKTFSNGPREHKHGT